MKKLLGILLTAALLFSLSAGTTAHAEGYDPVMKIGLYYDANALVAANLQNVSGMDVGYAFGYFDAGREFVSTYEIYDENKITVLKNVNLWLVGNDYLESEPGRFNAEIGAYCLQVDDLFYDADEAFEVAEDFEYAGYDAYLCYVRGGFRVRVGKYLSPEDAAAARNGAQRVGYDLVQRGPSGTCYTVVATGTDRILYQLDLLGDFPLGIMPMSRQTWFKQTKYYGGFEYYRPAGGDLNVINVVSLTDYVKGVIPYEISPSWPVEAQKAMALCAKCYALNNYHKHSAKGFDLCNTTDCQVYRGTNGATAVSDEAVEGVSGRYVVYRGEICETFYHASSGGYTEDAINIWGKDIPYLRAVEDTYLERMLPYSNTVTLDDITWILQAKGYTTQRITDVYVSRYSAAGNVLELTAVQANGQRLVFKGDRARTALNSPTRGVTVSSHRYTITGGTGGSTVSVNGATTQTGGLYAVGGNGKTTLLDAGSAYVITANGVVPLQITQSSGGTPGTYIIAGTGSGHNIGMSQWGAYSMGQKGFSCEEIISFYYTGATVSYYDPN
ncbi:MAG: SpoIID/LytB domain-containing protein [Clostridia bacterium]|nr:SpoIID/LytB domain-containing protein [Clostridia bacterium]